MASPPRVKVLYLCTGNSCRSQMAEALTRELRGNLVEAHSAGVDPKGLDPRAVRAMQELGIDISSQRSKSVQQVEGTEFDYVVTLYDQARESCPFYAAKTRGLHVPFEDPPGLAAGARDEEEAMEIYRRVRDEIRVFVEKLPEALQGKKTEEVSP